MLYLVIYDISDDKIRKKIETACKDMGLKRVQKSAFRGEMTSSQREELKYKFLSITEKTELTDIQIYPLSAEEAEKIVWLNNGIEERIESSDSRAVLII